MWLTKYKRNGVFSSSHDSITLTVAYNVERYMTSVSKRIGLASARIPTRCSLSFLNANSTSSIPSKLFPNLGHLKNCKNFCVEFNINISNVYGFYISKISFIFSRYATMLLSLIIKPKMFPTLNLKDTYWGLALCWVPWVC